MTHLFLSSGREFSRSDWRVIKSEWRLDICWTIPGADTYVDSPTWASNEKCRKAKEKGVIGLIENLTNVYIYLNLMCCHYLNGYLKDLWHHAKSDPDHPLLPVLVHQMQLELVPGNDPIMITKEHHQPLLGEKMKDWSMPP